MPTSGWLWFLAGAALGAGVIVPATRWRLRRERRRLAAAKRRADDVERLAQLGTLTGGLAHEIKNPLSTLSLNAQLLGEDVADSALPAEEKSRLLRRTETLRREADRLKGILADFLQFAGQIRLDPQPHDLNVLLEELVDFYLPQAQNAQVRLRFSPGRSPAWARVDSALLKQALLNLLINATQALETMSDPERSRELMLRVEKATEEDEEAGYLIHVTDTGPGIDPEHLSRIFHPYFSTKKGGTGLGLPTARRIVKEHGGEIEVHSEPGRGTDFVVRLPTAAPG